MLVCENLHGFVFQSFVTIKQMQTDLWKRKEANSD